MNFSLFGRLSLERRSGTRLRAVAEWKLGASSMSFDRARGSRLRRRGWWVHGLLVVLAGALSALPSGSEMLPADGGAAGGSNLRPGLASAPVYGYQVLNVYPHDTGAYTEGLLYRNGFLYESTGPPSTLRQVDIETGTVLKRHDLPSEMFGEGLAVLRDSLYQLTWLNHVAYAYTEADTFKQISTVIYPRAGWGLSQDGERLIASDGTATIRFLKPRTYEEISEIQVTDGGAPVRALNELEYIHGLIYANIYVTNRIAVIDPVTGHVQAWLDLSGLADSVSYDPHVDVLNGIAFDSLQTRLFVTGKLWPKLFQIDVPTLHTSGVPGKFTVGSAGGPGLRIQPNPCRETAAVSLVSLTGFPSIQPASLALFDSRGRRVLVPMRRGFGSTSSVEVDLQGVTSGIYFFHLANGAERASGKVIVAR